MGYRRGRHELAQFGFPFWCYLWREFLAHRIRMVEELDTHLISARIDSYLGI